MSNTKRWFSIALGSGLAVLLLVGALTIAPAFAQGGGMMGGSGGMGSGGMMGDSGFNNGMPFGSGGMMGATQGFSRTMPFAPGWMMGNQDNTGNFAFGPGSMMGGMMNGMMGQMMSGMMGGNMMVNSNNPFFVAVDPLTVPEVTETLDAYLAALNDNNLEVDDVMIFDNHAYAQIVEKDSGIGVMEVLVDPTTKAVYPEMGPNMMWNQKYGMMSGFGGYGMGMMMGGFGNMMGGFGATGTSTEMTVTPEQAVETAQTYLDTYFSETGLTADDHADPIRRARHDLHQETHGGELHGQQKEAPRHEQPGD